MELLGLRVWMPSPWHPCPEALPSGLQLHSYYPYLQGLANLAQHLLLLEHEMCQPFLPSVVPFPEMHLQQENVEHLLTLTQRIVHFIIIPQSCTYFKGKSLEAREEYCMSLFVSSAITFSALLGSIPKELQIFTQGSITRDLTC